MSKILYKGTFIIGLRWNKKILTSCTIDFQCFIDVDFDQSDIFARTSKFQDFCFKEPSFATVEAKLKVSIECK